MVEYEFIVHSDYGQTGLVNVDISFLQPSMDPYTYCEYYVILETAQGTTRDFNKLNNPQGIYTFVYGLSYSIYTNFDASRTSTVEYVNGQPVGNYYDQSLLSGEFTLSVDESPVPIPSTISLLALGLLGLVGVGRGKL